MKIATLFLWIYLFAIQVFAENNNGQIKQLKPGFYRISYPEQSIDVFFNYVPTNGLEHFFVEPDLPEIEKYEIVNILKQQIDLLPKSVINDYLDIDLFPLNIQNRYEFGYTFEKQIVVEISKIKEGMSYVNSVKSSLIHEIGHLIEEHPNYSSAAADLKNYFHAIHQTYDSPGESSETNIFQKGYVSRYASGEITNYYDASEEFAEIFTHLAFIDSRSALLQYVENNTETILSIKIDRFIDFLDNNISALGTEYIFNDIEHPEHTKASLKPLDGEQLLAAHEMRSYESFNFNAAEGYEDQLLANEEEDMFINNEPFNDWEKIEDESEWTAYQYSIPSHSFVIEKSNKKEKKKKKKKRNGTGLLITGAALYVLLQLLK